MPTGRHVHHLQTYGIAMLCAVSCPEAQTLKHVPTDSGRQVLQLSRANSEVRCHSCSDLLADVNAQYILRRVCGALRYTSLQLVTL